VRLILDNLPVTTSDLKEMPESVRPGFEIGYKSDDGKYYINNHLMFMILVHKTNGQYMRSQKAAAEMEAAAVVESGVRRKLSLDINPVQLLTVRQLPTPGALPKMQFLAMSRTI
jgi:Endomembrane protein 70